MAQRVDTWLVAVTLQGVNLGVWDSFSGGETDSEESKYRPGGMNEELSGGGRATIGNVTIARYQDDWLLNLQRWIRSQCGAGRGTIGRVPLNAWKAQIGPPEWYGGTLKAFSPPDIDSMGSDFALVELEWTIDSVG